VYPFDLSFKQLPKNLIFHWSKRIESTLWIKCFSPKHVGHNCWHPFIKYFLQSPFAQMTALSFLL